MEHAAFYQAFAFLKAFWKKSSIHSPKEYLYSFKQAQDMRRSSDWFHFLATWWIDHFDQSILKVLDTPQCAGLVAQIVCLALKRHWTQAFPESLQELCFWLQYNHTDTSHTQVLQHLTTMLVTCNNEIRSFSSQKEFLILIMNLEGINKEYSKHALLIIELLLEKCNIQKLFQDAPRITKKLCDCLYFASLRAQEFELFSLAQRLLIISINAARGEKIADIEKMEQKLLDFKTLNYQGVNENWYPHFIKEI
jgi:hypothetical protein